MTTLERYEYAPAFTALDFLEGDRADLTPRAKAHVLAHAKQIKKIYQRMVNKHTTGESVARIALHRLDEVLTSRG